MGNATEWRTDESYTCFCDSACYEVFNDCCTDYTKYCGEQKRTVLEVKKFNWTCEPLGNFSSTGPPCFIIGNGLWMVSRCAHDWPDDEIRSKCENPTTRLRSASDINRYIPAMDGNITFRNVFCARCNAISGNLDFFPVEIDADVLPPEHYNFTEKVNFLLLNGAEFPSNGAIPPTPTHRRRNCQMWPIVDSCPANISSPACTKGPVELVHSPTSRKTYKNYECGLCNDPQEQHVCFSWSVFGIVCHSTPRVQKFMLDLEYVNASNEEASKFTILLSLCGNGLTYDNSLQECVEHFALPAGVEDKFYILAWFAPSKDSLFTDKEFKTIMKRYFGVEESQIFNISINAVHSSFFLDPTPQSSILYHLVRSTLLLTPEQSLEILTDFSFSSTSLKLRNFVHFVRPLSVTLNDINYTIIKTTSRPLSCITRKLYAKNDYVALNDERVYITSTNITYKKSEYFGATDGNITICERYVATNCTKAFTVLTREDFVIHKNLSLSRIDTGMLYEFGQYGVFNNSITLCDLETPLTCLSEKSCAGRCSNHTEWRTELKMRCSCDPDCYEVFNDCCSDYTKYCGAQTPAVTPTKKYNYTCEDVGHHDSNGCTIGDGLSMVSRCRPEWPDDDSRSKCEQPVDKLTMSSPDLDRYLPVLGQDNTTFRNLYCAICNGVGKYESWPFDNQTEVIPPENYNVTEQIRSMLPDGDVLPERRGPWRPGAHQARRYCLKEIVDTCPVGESSVSCSNGSVALVSFALQHFKNIRCAGCHRRSSDELSCAPGELLRICRGSTPQPLSIVLDPSVSESETETRVLLTTEKCGRSGMIFDDVLQVCRVNWLSPPEKNTQERFYVFVWLQPPEHSQNNSFTATEYQESVAKHLNISRHQLSDINITILLSPETKSLLFYVVSSTIVLTPEQSLHLLSRNRNENTNSSGTRLLNFLYFSEPFTLQIKGISFSVTKTTTRPLACVGQRTYTPEQYTLLDAQRVYIPSLNTTYEKFEYFRENVEQLEVKRGNITVCEKFKPAGCNGTVVLYTLQEFTIFANLSIYVNKTSSLYHYGEYDYLPNKSVTICTVRIFRITKTRATIRDDIALGYITFVFFLLSILSLLFLLVTYIIFPHLRTLPGKNLMNLALSLLMFEILWLVTSSSEVRKDKPSCTAIAILEHYFLMASFVSMSVIAFHTCKVFARSLPAPKMSDGREKRLFGKYLTFAWLLPAIFIAICVALENQDVVKLGYGNSEICWLTEDNAYTYFVTIPVALLLLFNITAFVITAWYLRKHGQNRVAVQSSIKRQSNLSIYVKLSTLMGFTWLFGLLALVVPSATAFWYFFVIFTSLQGVFVAVAFVFNAKTFDLYRKSYGKSSNISDARRKITTRPKLAKSIYNDTKL